jgi:hypothetical protein
VGSAPDGGAGAANDGAASSWTLGYEDPGGPDDALHALWAASPDAVFAVGSDRQIVRWDGITWDALVKTAGAHLFGIWGASASDVVAVGLYASGGAPAAFYYDGTQWLVGGPFPPDVTPLTDAWGIGTQRYFTGLSGHIYQDDPINYPSDRYHTAVITGGCPDVTDPAPQLNGIDGSDLENILAVGDSALMAHRDASGWARFCAPDTSVSYASVTLIPGTKEFYVGSNYFGLLKWIDRQTPLLQIHENRELPNAEDSYLQALWAASAASVIGVGDGGTILYYDGGPDGARPLPSPTTDTLYAVVGVGDRTLYVAGKGNRIWKGELPDG